MQQLANDNNQGDVLPCLVIPVLGSRLILPNVTVAEIIAFQQPVQSGVIPEWVLGKIEWRGTLIPIVSYEGFCGQKSGVASQDMRIAIINAPNGDKGALRFFGLVVQGIPSLVKLEAPAIQENLNTTLGKGQKMAVTLETGHAIVPDIDAMEAELLSVDWQ